MGERRFFYGWIVLAAAATIICVGMGALFSLGVFLKPIEESMKWSRSGISIIALLNWIAMGIGSFLWGTLSDRVGTRAVVIAGGSLLGAGLVLSSVVSSLGQLYVTFGVMVGLGVGAFYAPLTSTATKWFTTKRGLAVALVSAGIGLGILIIAPLTRWLITRYDWRIAMLLLGDLAWLVIIPVGALIRNAPSGSESEAGAARPPVPEREFTPTQVARSPQFWAIALTHFGCCAAHSGPIFHMVTHAIDQGIPQLAAAGVLGVSGFSSIAGRIGAGVIADRWGATRTLVAGLGVQALLVLSYLFVHDLGSFYTLGAAFGIAYGGVMPLYAVVTREYFGEKVMGTDYGAVFLVSSLGMGVGSFAGGWFYDHLGSYAWLYRSSFAIGAVAAILALSFRPPRPLRMSVSVAPAVR